MPKRIKCIKNKLIIKNKCHEKHTINNNCPNKFNGPFTN